MTLYCRLLNCLSKQKELLADERRLTFATIATLVNYFAPHLKNSLLGWKIFLFNGLKLLSNSVQKLSPLQKSHQFKLQIELQSPKHTREHNLITDAQ